MTRRYELELGARTRMLATNGFAEGLQIARLHAVRWADGIAADGSAVRLFGFWVWSIQDWEWEVWPSQTSIETARGSLGELHAEQLVDENEWHVYDSQNVKIPLWEAYEPSEVTIVGPEHVEHVAGDLDEFANCEGCHLWSAITELAWVVYEARHA